MVNKTEQIINYDLNLVDKIREKDLDFLSDAEKVEKELLPELGFNNECIEEYPKRLQENCGKGLYSWQYPNQFSKYLVHLSKMNIESYLELGVRHGGTFIITLEYLNMFHPLKKALAVDLNPCPMIVEYKDKLAKSWIDFWQIDTASFKFAGFSSYCNGVDLTLIDADHGNFMVESDFNNVKKFSTSIALHDASNMHCKGVTQLWKRVKKDSMYESYEFMDQYEEFKKENKRFFGTGLLVSKDLNFIQ